MTSEALYLGIDGGGSGCRARLADATGRVLGEGGAGTAGLTLGVERTAGAVREAAAAAVAAAGLPPGALARLRAGIGVAGAHADATNAWAQALAAALPFASSLVRNDAEIACLGAHAGADGAILILGTGSHGLMLRAGAATRVGGWGFLLSDGGSGAVLGHRAARRALLAQEHLAPASALTDQIMARFDGHPSRMLEWALKAIPADWAALAPLVFDAALAGDAVGFELLSEATREVAGLLDRLVAVGAERIALLGGLAAAYRVALGGRFDRYLVAPLGDALDGALRLARQAR